MIRLCACAVFLVGCGGESRGEADSDRVVASAEPSEATSAGEHPGHTMDGAGDGGVLRGSGPWTVTASDGSHVTMTAGAEILPGPLELTFSVHAPDGSAAPVSLDLVSPTMPMHGLVRYPIVDGSAEIDLPMEGRWAIYVNLDDAGQASAEFLFDVPPGESGGHQHHGSQ